MAQSFVAPNNPVCKPSNFGVNSSLTLSKQYPNQALARSPSSTQSILKSRTLSSPKPRAPKVAKRPVPPRTDTKKARKQESRVQIPRLTRPLSELTASHEHIPIKDMSTWVNRSVATRLAENFKRGNYVTRPMNSFMLYRSAYSERTKFWCAQNNHQVVSTVSGQSWPLEPSPIRDQYAEYARLERENHAAANPTYRFRPHKNKKSKKGGKTRRGSSSASSDNDTLYSYSFSDEDECGDNSKQAAKKSAKGTKNSKNPTKSATSRHPLPPNESSPSPFSDLSSTGIDFGRQRSSFSASSPNMQPPVLLPSHHNNVQYIQSTHKSHPVNNSYTSDLALSTQKLPQPFCDNNNHFEHAPLTALPGGSAGNMLFDHANPHHHNTFHIDPMLYDSFSNGVLSPSFDQELGFANEATSQGLYGQQDFTHGVKVGDIHDWASVEEWAYGK